MGWRIIQITTPCRLSVKNKQLRYEPETGDAVTFPLEDVSVVLLENPRVSLTAALLSAMAEYGVCLFSCDGTHTPNGVFTPFATHFQHSAVAHVQQSASEPLKKRLWQKIVKVKIENQATVLRRLGNRDATKLREIAKSVQSGDSENAEAFAARLYFQNAFEFSTRRDDSFQNAALNYGYAVLRGAVARALVCAGLLPCFGLHHANNLNPYNLADDIIEPFRPFVDWIVVNAAKGDADGLTREHKKNLVAVLTKNCCVDDEDVTVLKAIERAAETLVNAFRDKQAGALSLPVFSDTPLFG